MHFKFGNLTLTQKCWQSPVFNVLILSNSVPTKDLSLFIFRFKKGAFLVTFSVTTMNQRLSSTEFQPEDVKDLYPTVVKGLKVCPVISLLTAPSMYGSLIKGSLEVKNQLNLKYWIESKQQTNKRLGKWHPAWKVMCWNVAPREAMSSLKLMLPSISV